MKLKKRGPLLLIITLGLLLLLPLGMYLAVTRTELRRSAAAGEIIVNAIPPSQTLILGEEFEVDIALNTDGQRVSGATIALDVSSSDGARFELVDLSIVTGGSGFFTDVVTTEEDPYTFTVLAKSPDEALPSGTTVQLATLTLRATENGTVTVGLDEENSYFVGAIDSSDNVTYAAVEGVVGTYTIVGELCQAQQCVASESIELVAEPRDDRRFNVQVSWDGFPNGYTVHKVYRSIGQPVGNNHSENDLVATVSDTQVTDTNNDEGYEGLSDIYYDIDTYIVCPDSIPPAQIPTNTPTPTSANAQPTNTPVPGATSCNDPLRLCANVCTDVQNNNQHCGACGNPCSASQTCQSGQCVPVAQPTNTPIPNTPVPLQPGPADTPLQLPSQQGYSNLETGQCTMEIQWDFTGYEAVNPIITQRLVDNGGIQGSETTVCRGVTGCSALGNPIYLSVDPGITTLRLRILNGQVESEITYQCFGVPTALPTTAQPQP